MALSTPEAPSLWLPDPPPPQKGTRAGVGVAQGTLGLVCAREEEATKEHEGHLVRAEAATAIKKGVCESTLTQKRLLSVNTGEGGGRAPLQSASQYRQGTVCNAR